MIALFRYKKDFGRMGNLEGLFIADYKKLQEVIETKKKIYFGEVLGKHSEIETYLEWSDLELISKDDEVLGTIKQYNLETGYNPLEYLGE